MVIAAKKTTHFQDKDNATRATKIRKIARYIRDLPFLPDADRLALSCENSTWVAKPSENKLFLSYPALFLGDVSQTETQIVLRLCGNPTKLHPAEKVRVCIVL